MIFCSTHNQCFAQQSSEKLSIGGTTRRLTSVQGYRVSDFGMLSTKWDVSNKSLHFGLRETYQRGSESTEMEDTLNEDLINIAGPTHTHELTGSFLVCIEHVWPVPDGVPVQTEVGKRYHP